jgi:hypothetical protein
MNLKLAHILPLALFVPPPVGWSQQQRTATIVTKTSRPLSELSQALVLKEGWLVDYEDPAYVYLGDLLDVTQTETSQSFRGANPRSVFFGVRSSPVAFTFDPQKPAFMINLELARTEADAPDGGQIIVTMHELGASSQPRTTEQPPNRR